MLSDKPGTYWYYLFTTFGMTLSLIGNGTLISLSMLSDKPGTYWYYLFTTFGMTLSLIGNGTVDLKHSNPAL